MFGSVWFEPIVFDLKPLEKDWLIFSSSDKVEGERNDDDDANEEVVGLTVILCGKLFATFAAIVLITPPPLSPLTVTTSGINVVVVAAILDDDDGDDDCWFESMKSDVNRADLIWLAPSSWQSEDFDFFFYYFFTRIHREKRNKCGFVGFQFNGRLRRKKTIELVVKI